MEERYMPMRRTKMNKIREILRYKEQSQFSERAISRALNISRPVVKQYLTLFEKSGLDYTAIQQMDDDLLLEVLSDKSPAIRRDFKTLTDQFEYFIKELKRPGVTLQRLWEEYILPCTRTAFNIHSFAIIFIVGATLWMLVWPSNTKPVIRCFVDFTGQKLHIVDRETGEEIPVEVFVAVLGASQRTYVRPL
jgi:transposase